MSEDLEWFAPKRYGYGAGLPISWQGWALMVAFIAVVIPLALWLADRPIELLAALVLPTTGFMVICAKTTRGGWRWRWGERD